MKTKAYSLRNIDFIRTSNHVREGLTLKDTEEFLEEIAGETSPWDLVPPDERPNLENHLQKLQEDIEVRIRVLGYRIKYLKTTSTKEQCVNSKLNNTGNFSKLEARPPSAFLVDALLPVNDAPTIADALEELFAERWLPKYGPSMARVVFYSQVALTIMTVRGQLLGKVALGILGVLGLRKMFDMFGRFSG